jgi:hypothetical protein
MADLASSKRFGLLLIALAALGVGPARAAGFDLEYDASIQNVVNLGKITLKANVAPNGYLASATVRTAGFARLFDDTRISASVAGATTPQGLAWTSYELSHAYGKKFRSVSMRRTAAGVTASISPAYRDMGTPPASPAQQRASRDPVTTIVEMARAVAASRLCAGVYPVFDGKQYYTLALSPKGAGDYEGGGYRGPALVCTLRYKPVAGYSMSAVDIAKIPVVEIWFATARPGFAIPLRIEVATPVGAARLDLARATA